MSSTFEMPVIFLPFEWYCDCQKHAFLMHSVLFKTEKKKVGAIRWIKSLMLMLKKAHWQFNSKTCPDLTNTGFSSV